MAQMVTSVRDNTQPSTSATRSVSKSRSERLESLRTDLRSAGGTGSEIDRARTELDWAAELAEVGSLLAAERVARRAAIRELPAAVRHPLAERLGEAIEAHAKIWSLRNRPGGRADSQARLLPTHRQLAAG